MRVCAWTSEWTVGVCVRLRECAFVSAFGCVSCALCKVTTSIPSPTYIHIQIHMHTLPLTLTRFHPSEFCWLRLTCFLTFSGYFCFFLFWLFLAFALSAFYFSESLDLDHAPLHTHPHTHTHTHPRTHTHNAPRIARHALHASIWLPRVMALRSG